MKKIIAGTLLSLLFSAAQAQESNVLQLFACNFHDGKTVENLWDVAERVRDLNTGPSADELAGSFIWLPYRSGMGYDYIWGIVNSDLNSMAAGGRAFVESGNAAIMGPRFAAVGDCISGIYLTEQIKAGTLGNTADDTPDALVETFTCNHINGADMDDVRKATDYWLSQSNKLESAAFEGYEAFHLTTLRGGSGTFDWGWIGTNPDMASWAQMTKDYVGSPEGAAADARFEAISKCRSALWQGYWVTVPANRM